jgi:hypothetical protein
VEFPEIEGVGMYTDPGATCGGMWASLDDSRIKFRVDPGWDYGEFTPVGAFEASLGTTEKTVTRCLDLFARALRDMRKHETNDEQSWMHQSAPTTPTER